jgi:TniQ
MCFYDLIDQIAATLNTSVAVCFSELEIPNYVQYAYRTKRPLFLDLITCRDIAMRLDVPAEAVFETTWMSIAKPILTRKKWAAWEIPSVALKTYVAAALRFDTTESKICPICLAENKPGRLAWQTGWLFACTRHRVLLVDQCPECKLPPGQLRRPSRIPKPSQCENHPAHGNPCQQVLADVSVVRLEKFPDLLHAQNRLEAALCGRVSEFAGQRCIACEYLLGLQDLLNLLCLIAPFQTLKQVPVEVRESFNVHYEGRGNGLIDADFESLEIQAASKANPKTMNTKLFAAHISLALEIADLVSAQAVENRLMQMIGLACENEPRFARQIMNHIIFATRKQRRTQLFLIFRELYHRVKQQYHLYADSKSM